MQGIAFQFRVAGMPILVSWSFLIVVGLLTALRAGQDTSSVALMLGIQFGVVLFASILVHELGHAFAGQRLKLRPDHIMIHGFGGHTTYGRRPRPKEGILMSLAGPVAGLSLGILALVTRLLVGNQVPQVVIFFLDDLVFINFFWSLFNLMPISPMDGGHALEHGLRTRMGAEQTRGVVRIVSIGAGAMVVVAALAAGAHFLAIFTVWIVVQGQRRA